MRRHKATPDINDGPYQFSVETYRIIHACRIAAKPLPGTTNQCTPKKSSPSTGSMLLSPGKNIVEIGLPRETFRLLTAKHRECVPSAVHESISFLL
jgi:hypothetical protein